MGADERSVSVIMPAFNEEEGLRSAVEQTMETFRSLEITYEIIIVDDHSSDRTAEIAEGLATVYDSVSCLHHERNQGIGAGLRTGAAAANNAYILLIPVDNPLTAEEIRPFLSAMGHSDIILGVRPERVGYPAFARFASSVYSKVLVPVLFGIRFSDINWIQMWRTRWFRDGILQVNCRGMVFMLELLIQAQRHGLKVVEVPAPMRKRVHGEASCFKISFMWRTSWELLRLFVRTRLARRP